MENQSNAYNPVANLVEVTKLINKLVNVITESDRIAPEAIRRVTIYNSEIAIYLQGDDLKKRAFTQEVLRRLRVTTLKRDLDNPTQLSYTFVLEGRTEYYENEKLEFRLKIDNYPANFTVSCEKTCYAIYKDGTRKPVVRKAAVDEHKFTVKTNQL